MATTIATHPLLNDRSLAYRKVSTFGTQLQLFELESERLQVVSNLLTGVNELQVARKVHEMECNILGEIQQAQDEDKDSSAFNARASAPLRKAAQKGELLDFVLLMQQSHNKVQGALQEKALSLLRKEIAANPQSSKLKLLNHGVLVAIVDALKNFPTRPKIQRDGTALLMTCMNDHVAIFDTQGNNVAPATNNEGIDLGILRIIHELGGFDLLVEALQRNLYQLEPSASFGFMKHHAHNLAKTQIPLVIEIIKTLLLSSSPDFVLLQKKCRFLLKCYATLLDDNGITQTTLTSYVL